MGRTRGLCLRRQYCEGLGSYPFTSFRGICALDHCQYQQTRHARRSGPEKIRLKLGARRPPPPLSSPPPPPSPLLPPFPYSLPPLLLPPSSSSLPLLACNAGYAPLDDRCPSCRTAELVRRSSFPCGWLSDFRPGLGPALPLEALCALQSGLLDRERAIAPDRETPRLSRPASPSAILSDEGLEPPSRILIPKPARSLSQIMQSRSVGRAASMTRFVGF